MRIFTAALFAALIFTSEAQADLAEGRVAYNSENWIVALAELRPLAEEGNDEALVLLGNMYNDGKGVEQNHKIAFEHYKQALPSGNSNAMLAIATMYAQGLGVDKDFPTAFEWFEKSATAGNPAAQFMMGSFYLKDQAEISDFKADLVKSYGWFRIAARQTELPDVAKAGKELARRLTVQMSPQQILDGEAIADNYYKSDEVSE